VKIKRSLRQNNNTVGLRFENIISAIDNIEEISDFDSNKGSFYIIYSDNVPDTQDGIYFDTLSGQRVTYQQIKDSMSPNDTFFILGFFKEKEGETEHRKDGSEDTDKCEIIIWQR